MGGWSLEIEMLKAIFLISAGGLAVLAGCAGERKSTGLVANDPSADAAAGTSYKLVFSTIDPEPDNSGATVVSVKLKNGDVVVTHGELSQVVVTLKYRVNNVDGEDYFEEFDDGGKRKLRSGAATFRVRLDASKLHHQLRAEAVVDDREVRGESGIFSVLSEGEADAAEEEEL